MTILTNQSALFQYLQRNYATVELVYDIGTRNWGLRFIVLAPGIGAYDL